MCNSKLTSVDSDLIFFIWQILNKIPVGINERSILIEQGNFVEGWNCSGFDDWASKYNKTEIFRYLIESAIDYGLIEEVVISIREKGKNKFGHPDMIEIERFNINKTFLKSYRENFPFGQNNIKDIYTRFGHFYTGYYSLADSQYIKYFSYKINSENSKGFLKNYLVDWYKDLLKKPRNYIKPVLQVEKFISKINEYVLSIGIEFDYTIGDNPDLDEATIIIYLQAIGWIKIKEYDDGLFTGVLPITGNEKKKFYLHIEESFLDAMKERINFQDIRIEPKNTNKNKLIVEIGSDYFISNTNNNPIRVTGNGLKIITKIYTSRGNTINLSKATFKQKKATFNRALGRLNEKLKQGGLVLVKVRGKDEFILKQIEN